MNGILVAETPTSKVYYILDAKKGERDGLVVMGPNKKISVNLFSWMNKATNAKKIKETKFQKMLWSDEISKKDRQNWIDTFVKKSKEIDKRILDAEKIVKL